MGVSSHLPPLGEGLPRGKPPERQKENQHMESWTYGYIWAPRYSHVWRYPLDFSVTCGNIFPFLHKPFWIEFLPHSTEAPARYDKLLSSKAQLKCHLLPKIPPVSTPTLLVHSSCALPWLPYASIWSLDRDLLKGQGPHSHSWQYPQLSNGAQ